MSNIRVRELAGIRAVGREPTAEDLEILAGETFAGGAVSPGEVNIREVFLCHNQHDYTLERFPKAYLDRFAETIPGKSVLPGHDAGELPIGRWFRGRLQQRVEKEFPVAPKFEPAEAKVTWLRTGFYFVNDPATELFRKNIDTGVYKWVSIGFRFDDLICDVCNKSYLGGECPHIIGRPAEPGSEQIVMATYGGDPKRVEALEGSLVFLGAQQQARITRATRGIDPEALAATPFGEDRVALKHYEALAREGMVRRAWSFRGHMPDTTTTESGSIVVMTGDDVVVRGATAFGDLPLCERDRAWDASAAEGRVREWAGAEEAPNAKYRRAFLRYDSENASNFTAYKLPFADVEGGQLRAVPRGLFACAAVMQGARGGVDIPEADVPGVKRHIARYYAKMAEEFGDPSLTPPWEQESLPVGSEKPAIAGETETAPVGAEVGEAEMTAEERAAMEAATRRIAELEVLLESQAAATETLSHSLTVQLEAREPLAVIGEKALAEAREAILADDLRLRGSESAETAEVVKLLVERRDYARLQEIAAEKRQAVLARFPAEPVGQPEPPEATGTHESADLLLRDLMR